MAEDNLKRHRISVARMLREWAQLHHAPAVRLALSAFCVLATLTALSVSLPSAAHAQQCQIGNVLCPDNFCYPLGSQCCAGGGACNAGYNCWRGAAPGSFCCPGGTFGTADGYCSPNGFQYCGRGRYCVTGHCDSRCASGCCL